jgi:hypothetical protein
MATPKEELVEFVEAYAAAKKADNPMLMRLASAALGNFLQQIDVVKEIPVPEDLKKQVVAQLPKTSRKTPTRPKTTKK